MHFLRWTRLTAAHAGKLWYRARVFLEGVPRHVWQIEAVKSLFHESTYIHGEENFKLQDKEKSCFGVKVCTTDPGLIAKTGTLKIPEAPPMHFRELGIEEVQPERSGPIPTLNYDVLLHLDEVVDYTPLPARPESKSQDTAEEWPRRHVHAWSFGVKDGCRPQLNQSVTAREAAQAGG